MSNAYVLMTALPPTKGHLHLIQFARSAVNDTVHVLLNTQPSEPFPAERAGALKSAIAWNHHLYRTQVHVKHEEIQQVPDGPDDAEFWEFWRSELAYFGCGSNDYIVASEEYGQKLAEITGATFLPYDIDRDVFYTHATEVREYPLATFSDILPEFQPYVRKTVTFFGAESVGKTTTSKFVAQWASSHWLPEWARPYMERFAPEVTRPVMERIWQGQLALQRQGQMLVDAPFIVQDTDLFSTVGYWELYDDKLGVVPNRLIQDAVENKSDLYLILASNIPFAPDPLRFGGTVRETSDQFWMDLCKEYELNYQIIDDSEMYSRQSASYRAMTQFFDKNAGLAYDRVTG